METFDPDLVAVQEALDFQLDFLGEQLGGYGATGGFREGGRKGEYTGILFRRSRLELVREGVFWLSETPSAWVPGDGTPPCRASVPGRCSAIDSRIVGSRCSRPIWTIAARSPASGRPG